MLPACVTRAQRRLRAPSRLISKMKQGQTKRIGAVAARLRDVRRIACDGHDAHAGRTPFIQGSDHFLVVVMFRCHGRRI